MTNPQSPKLSREYRIVHQIINAMASESSIELDPDEVACRVKELHPDLSMEPGMLREAIKTAIANLPGSAVRC